MTCHTIYQLAVNLPHANEWMAGDDRSLYHNIFCVQLLLQVGCVYLGAMLL